MIFNVFKFNQWICIGTLKSQTYKMAECCQYAGLKKIVILKLRTNDVAKLSLPDFHLQMTNGSYLENANGRSLELMDGGGLQTMSLMRLAQYQSRRL